MRAKETKVYTPSEVSIIFRKSITTARRRERAYRKSEASRNNAYTELLERARKALRPFTAKVGRVMKRIAGRDPRWRLFQADAIVCLYEDLKPDCVWVLARLGVRVDRDKPYRDCYITDNAAVNTIDDAKRFAERFRDAMERLVAE